MKYIFPVLMGIGMVVSAFAIVVSLQASSAPAAPPAQIQNSARVEELAAQGRALFVAKGCIVCHRHDALAEFRPRDFASDNVPNLSHLKMDADSFYRWLRDPAAVKPSTAMPNLNLSANEMEALAAFLLSTEHKAAGDCAFTRFTASSFVPPAPYPAQAPFGEFWHGTEELWTALRPDGRWDALPYHGGAYTQKIVWWRKGYVGTNEPQPALKITGKQLDGDKTFVVDGATNAHSADFGGNGWAIMSGVEIPAPGCWEITGEYCGNKTSFVVQVVP